jgi:glyoxylase-like metal-dependent hydrolase (beta-lactamase superfamily II)
LENLLTITIRSTHFYLIDFGKGKLLVDVGWAGSLARLKGELKSLEINPREISYILATHYHPDHGGLVQEVKRDFGARLIIHERQIAGITELAGFYAKKGGGDFLPIQVEKGDLLLKSAVDDNRAALKALGLEGVLVETPGHSDDSVTLVLDSGRAFPGDLHPPDYSLPDAYEVTCESWRNLIRHNARLFYPSHSEPFSVDVIQNQLENCV